MIGQTDLFKGKRQRGVKAPSPTEFAVHVSIADTLNRWICPGWLWFHPPNGGERAAKVIAGRRVSIEGGRLQRMGVKPGVSDFVFVRPPDGRFHALELKRRGHKPTPAQTLFGTMVRNAGGQWHWVDCYPDAIAILQQWGVLPKTIKV
ncbi:MAG: hypothetical protein ABWY63_14305 [Hyphomicrobiaceae bacterium]